MFALTSTHVVLPGQETATPATIEFSNSSGKITRIHPFRATRDQYHSLPDDAWIDVGDLVVFPGIVDAHVHLNEPGRTEWEGFRSGTRAAIQGGVTTVVDMPLNSIPPTTTVPNLLEKRQASEGHRYCDLAFWGGLVPNNHQDLLPLVSEGVKGFKCFLIDSGVEEFPCVNMDQVEEAMSILEGKDTVLLFHAEMQGELQKPSDPTGDDPTHYSTFLTSRPPELELHAIESILSSHRLYPKLRCHIVHLSTAEALPVIRKAKSDSSAPLTVETCFHYLFLTAEMIPDGRPDFKCCPPIRSDSNRDQLWEAIKDGTIDCVVSDHSPCVSSLKHMDDGNIMDAWGGISSLGLGLSLLWTEGRHRDISFGQLARLLSQNTAAHGGLSGRKGKIAVDHDADFVIWDPDGETKITTTSLHFKNKLSPYVGQTIYGIVQKTILRGNIVWDRAKSHLADPTGVLL